MKVYYARGVDIHDGKVQDAWAWAVKVANYGNENYPEASFEVVQQVGGELNRIIWLSPFESLAAYEAFLEKFEADEGYQQLLAETREAGHFSGSSLRDSLFRVMA